MANSLMCRIVLTEDAGKEDWEVSRMVRGYFSLAGENSNKGSWAIESDASSDRLSLRASAGTWEFSQHPSDDRGDVYLMTAPGGTTLLMLYGVPRNFLARADCSFSWSSNGIHWRTMGDIVYNLYVPCV